MESPLASVRFSDRRHSVAARPRMETAAWRTLWLLGALLWWAAPVLAQSGVINITVRDAITRAPIVTGIGICVEEGAWCRAPMMTTDANGNARSTVNPGVYYLFTVGIGASRAYVDEIFSDILCPGTCSIGTALSSGTPLVVTPGGTVRADFELHRGGAIAGTLTDARTSAPLAGVTVWATLVSNGQTVGWKEARTDASGRYVIEGLPPGRYHAWTDALTSSGYLNEVYDNVACGRHCEASHVVAGTPIDVAVGVTADGRDFALDFGGRITGTVTDAATMMPLAGVRVYALAPGAPPPVFPDAYTDATGAYETGALPAGNYLLLAEPIGGNHVAELYDDVPCPGRGCDLAEGTLVPLTLGNTTSGRDFALEPGGSISGVVRDAATGQSITGAVSIYTRQGSVIRPAGRDTVDYETGAYVVNGLPAGTYYAYTSVPGYRNEIFDDVRCQAQDCTEQELATLGTAITVASGGTTSGVDFAVANDLLPGPPDNLRTQVNGSRVWLSWGAPSSGGMPAAYLLEAGASPGTTFVQASTAVTQFVVGAVLPGRYFVRVRAVNANGIGPASDEELVVVPSPPAPPDAPSDLGGWMAGPRLTLTWGTPWAPAGITGYVVEAGSATGLTDITSIAVNARSLTVVPVPAGFYFVRVRAMNAHGIGPASNEVLINSGDVPAPPLPPHDLVSRITGSTVTLEWSPPPGQTAPVGYVLRAGSAPGLSNLAQATAGPAQLSLTFDDVPVGVYYVRVHAVGALGPGPASNELIVIVK